VANDEQTVAALLRAAGLCPVELRVLQQAAIHNALDHAEGNRTHAARSLGISVRTLQRAIKEWSTSVETVGADGGFHSEVTENC
jgi:DNA-binding NtrC family response regulator